MDAVWPVIALVIGLLAGMHADRLREKRQQDREREATKEGRRNRYLDLRLGALIELGETLTAYAVSAMNMSIEQAGLDGFNGPAERRRELEDHLGSLKRDSWPTTLHMRALVARISDETLTTRTNTVMAFVARGASHDPVFIHKVDAAHDRCARLLEEISAA